MAKKDKKEKKPKKMVLFKTGVFALMAALLAIYYYPNPPMPLPATAPWWAWAAMLAVQSLLAAIIVANLVVFIKIIVLALIRTFQALWESLQSKKEKGAEMDEALDQGGALEEEAVSGAPHHPNAP